MKNYCYSCMEEISQEGFCTNCMKTNEADKFVHHLKPGTVLNNKYLVGNCLGEGGFGITYIGRDLTLDIKVAIKEFFPNGFVNRNNEANQLVTATTESQSKFFSKGKERFLQEARNIAKFIGEPGIVSIREYFECNNTAYIIMEYLDGENLLSYIKKNGRMAPEYIVRLILPIIRSLQKIHDVGIIHRDISPDNIMYLKNGSLKLMDFGSARYFTNEEKEMSVVLKHGYAPEEQYRKNGNQGPWTDVYGLCATLYKCITGETPEDALGRLRTDGLKRPSDMGVGISGPLENVLMYGLAVFKENRCQDMRELEYLIITALNQQNVSVPYGRGAREDIYRTQAADNDKTRAADKPVSDLHPQEKKRSSGAAIALICVFLTLLIAGSAVAVAVLIKRDNSSGGSNDSQSTSETEKTNDIQIEAIQLETETAEAPVKMPNLVGMTKEEAIDKLAEYNLVVSDIIETETNAQSPGKVFSHAPKEKTDVTNKTEITLYIAKAISTEKAAEKPTEKQTASSNTTADNNDSPVAGETLYSIVRDYLNIREEPNVNSKSLGKIWRGQTMRYISKSDVWYYVEFKGTYGYVRSRSTKNMYVSSSDSFFFPIDEYITVKSDVPPGQYLRKNASNDSQALDELSPDMKLDLVGDDIIVIDGETDGDSYHGQWVKVRYNGKDSYVYDKNID